MDNDRALSIKEVAEFLSISNQMVYNMIRDKQLPAFKIGASVRILRSDLMDYVQKQKQKMLAGKQKYENTDNSLFVVKNLNASLGEFLIKDISFELPKGKILALLGPSGSGKTVLLKSIAGLIEPDSGWIYNGKERIDSIPVNERQLGFVFQEYALFPHLTSKKNIQFPLKQMKISDEELDTKTSQVIAELGIQLTYLSKSPKELPEGMKQLVAIGRERGHATELYLMDEPMSNLDAHIRREMRAFLKRYIRVMGKTTIIAVNSPEDALAVSDYIGIIEDGTLLQFGPTFEIYNNPLTPTVMNMVSPLGVNYLHVQIKNNHVQGLELARELKDGEYLMAFRPREVEINGKGGKAKVLKTNFLDGSAQLAHCRTSEEEDIHLVIPNNRAVTGDEVSYIPINPVFFPA
ncbi:MAG: ATP-binding cassette domain-containing protein [Spirochaetia bacterium]